MSKIPSPPPPHALSPEKVNTPAWNGPGVSFPSAESLDPGPSAEIQKKEERKAKLSSLVITVMIHVIAVLILTLIILPGQLVDVPQIQAKTISEPADALNVPTPTQATVRSKPSAASATARLLSSTAPSSAVFLPTVNTETTFADIGAGTGVGLGLGFGGTGSGPGGKVGFFGQTSSARRVAFVIDYSLSMKGGREAIMRKELAKTVKELKPGINYTLIFFAGPAWFAGDELKNIGGPKKVVVRGEDKESYKWEGKSPTEWKIVSDKLPQVRWRDASGSNIRESLKHIEETNLVWGTDWDDPLEIALDANPKPDVIYFMTDGIAGDRSMATAQAIAKRATSGSSKVVINCISMMEPKALEPMKVMAQKTGGQMTVINQDGSRKVVIGRKK